MSVRDAVIVSTARTPIGRAYKGAFNDTPTQELGGHAIAHAVKVHGDDVPSWRRLLLEVVCG